MNTFEMAARDMADTQTRINEVSRLISFCGPELKHAKENLQHEMIELMLSRDIISLKMGWISQVEH